MQESKEEVIKVVSLVKREELQQFYHLRMVNSKNTGVGSGKMNILSSEVTQNCFALSSEMVFYFKEKHRS